MPLVLSAVETVHLSVRSSLDLRASASVMSSLAASSEIITLVVSAHGVLFLSLDVTDERRRGFCGLLSFSVLPFLIATFAMWLVATLILTLLVSFVIHI